MPAYLTSIKINIMQLDKDKALVVFSGGQDSTTCLYWALEQFREVHTITFTYGQKHSLEVDMARSLAAKAGMVQQYNERNSKKK